MRLFFRALSINPHLLAFFVLFISQNVAAVELHATAASASGIEGYTHQQLLALGERMYRTGILPDGTAMQAWVQGDIPADGQVFTCALCHRRSGLGTSEGAVIALPINSTNLFRSRVSWDTRRRHSGPELSATPLRQVPASMLGEALRQPYDDQALAQAVREGIDPDGRVLDYVMPRYALDVSDMAVLIYYLKHLTNSLSAGVTDKIIHFATIVTDGVDESDKDAMLSVIQAIIDDRNSQTRNQIRRAESGAFNRRELNVAYRKLELSLWELRGPPQTWKKQLDAYYKQQPVFAVLGGMANGDWAPIHEFSESQGLPVIFPLTDRPVISDSDWHTLYFSKGLYQEGEAAASFIRRQNTISAETRVIQIYSKGSEGEVVAQGFADKWKGFNKTAVHNYPLQENGLPDKASANVLAKSDRPMIVLLWATDEEIAATDIFNQPHMEKADIFVSATLLHDNYLLIPDALKARVNITYPYSLPEDKQANIASLKTWLRIRGIPDSNLQIQARMYFLGWVLSDALAGIKSEFYQDYFLEKIEMMKDQTHSISVYPRLSLGPDQRYASKGCYIVQLAEGEAQQLLKKSDWIIY